MAQNLYDIKVKPYLDDIAEWTMSGISEKNIAMNLGISYSSFKRYKKQNEVLETVLLNSKSYANKVIENAMFRNAKGYSHETEKAFKVKEVFYDDKNRRCEKESVEVVIVTEKFPPNVQAGKYWLNNRDPDNWKEKPDDW